MLAAGVSGTLEREPADGESAERPPRRSGAERGRDARREPTKGRAHGRAPQAQTRRRTSRTARRRYATGRPGNAPPGLPRDSAARGRGREVFPPAERDYGLLSTAAEGLSGWK